MNRRLFLFRLFSMQLFLLLVGQLFRLQIKEGSRYARQAEQNRIRQVFTSTLRGVIYDRNGKQLVRNLPSFSVSIVPADVPKESTAQPAGASLAGAAPLSVSSAARQGASAMAMFAWLESQLELPKNEVARRVERGRANPFAPILLKANVERDVALKIEERRGDLPGVVVDIVPIREYVDGSLLSAVVGYVGRITRDEYESRRAGDRTATINDSVGRMGIEFRFDNDLRGQKGEKVIEVDAAGREVGTLASLARERPGSSLILTIDVDLQREATRALQQGMQAAGAKSGAVVALNPNTGEVLALVSEPSYDNNLFAGAISDRDWQRLIEDPNRPLFNRAIGGSYPPGSIFKIVTATAGLQDGVVDRDTRIRCDGKIVIEDQYDPFTSYTFPCWVKEGHGSQNVIDALAHSCDVFFYHVGGGLYQPSTNTTVFSGLGLERLNKYVREFGLGRETGLDLPGESVGLAPTNQWKLQQPWNTRGEPWLTGDTYQLAIGQSFLLATPLQMANMIAVIANGGMLYRPQIVYQVVDAEGKVTRGFQKDELGRVSISARNLELVREGLRAAVTRGTAIAANFARAATPGTLAVVGKTGTAEYGQPDEKGEHRAHAWFVSYAPEDKPTVALAVFIEDGKNGAKYAVPVASQIYQYLFRQPDAPPSIQ